VSDLPFDPHARYWPRYCEENVWHWCEALAGTGRDALVLVVASPSGRVAVFRQRAARPPGGAVAWDYHVLLLLGSGAGWLAVDPDSTLPCPCAAGRYLDESFPDLPERLSAYRPRFRVIDAATYREALASDRRHMRDGRGGFFSDPPPWPPVGRGHNLHRLVDVRAQWIGDILDIAGLRARLGLRARTSAP